MKPDRSLPDVVLLLTYLNPDDAHIADIAQFLYQRPKKGDIALGVIEQARSLGWCITRRRNSAFYRLCPEHSILMQAMVRPVEKVPYTPAFVARILRAKYDCG